MSAAVLGADAVLAADIGTVFLVLAVVGLVIWLGYWSWKKEKQRRLELEGWASHNGLRFSETRDGAMDDRYPLFSCLRQGSNRYAYNVMRGQLEGRDACCFDYHYETYSTSSKGQRQTHHHHFSALVLATNLPMKQLFLRPEGFFDKVTEFFGADDIDFESAQFSREFFVKAADKRWAFDVIHQATMEFLLGAPRYHMQFAGPWVCAWRGGRFKAVDFQGAVHVTTGILQRLPRYVIQDLTGAGP